MIPFFRFIQFCTAVKTVIFFAGTSCGVYERWEHHSSDRGFVFLWSAVITFYSLSFLAFIYGYRRFSSALLNFWNGIILCFFAFTPVAYDHLFVSLQDINTTDILLLLSVFVKCALILVERLCGKAVFSPKLLTCNELCLIAGFVFASSLTGREFQFALLAVALSFTVASFHLKSSLSLLNALCFIVITHELFFPVLSVKFNPFCMVVFLLELCFLPVVDMFFSPLSVLERWNPLFNSPKWKKRCLNFTLFIFECLYIAFSAQVFYRFERFFYSIVFFAIATIAWFSFHMLFLITWWGFFAKVEACYHLIRAKCDFSDGSISKVFSSKGVRHFCLISHMVVFAALISTIVTGIVSLQGADEYMIAFFLIVLSQEHIMYSLLKKLGTVLGGTAIGYALVTPTFNYSQAGEVLLLTKTSYQTKTTRSMALLNEISQFFSDHTIHNFGTDFCTSGITEDYVQEKVKSFFAQDMIEGVNFDTYILYYSGQTTCSGDWALSNNQTLVFESIMNWWQSRNSTLGARLILILDSAHSQKWLTKVQSLRSEFVAIQTGTTQVSDEESGNVHLVGELTRLWVHFNSCENKSGDYWDKNSVEVKPVYSVSREWCNFQLHKPTDEDISQHVQKNFPSITKPFIGIVRILYGSLSCPFLCICESFMQCFRRAKLKWFPPNQLDTGHGFKLITVH